MGIFRPETQGRPSCKNCGLPCVISCYHRREKNKPYYRNYCGSCEYKRKKKPFKHYANKPNGKYKYRLYKKDTCELCGFIPINLCQLDVDHIDGNKENKLEENLQTLCANCHRLKTFLNKDGTYRNT